ncbi:hypothetical protein H9X57_16020 [Flavobacterium piscinae]|uniref:hypothetical protein n=1 Tax=Flavobacterium piscinae TaxID=2506424 RepID=UPI0019C78823|nr:hypothetical protein [Flavobacterium piscinae]MBC8884340.1 hypothetical protein [Flavobacterium piscinae]
MREVYYFTRHQYFTQYIEAFVVKDANIFYPFDLYPNAIFFQKEEEFINHFMAFLKDNKIPYDIVIGTARYNGPITDLLIQQNVTILLRVNTANPLYLEFFTPFTSADQFNYQLENTKAYLLQVSKNKKVVDSEMITLPGSTKKDNVSKSITKVKLIEDLSTFKVERENYFSGHYKPSEQSNKLYFFDYVYNDYQRYGTASLLEKVKNKRKKSNIKKNLTH